MAITKIHNIKSTIDKAIDYICDKKKTDDKILVSTFACGEQTAGLEFEKTKEQFGSKVKILARHLIQSFDPDDNITPETAHEIGKKLMDKVLKEKYEYVIATHLDKGHLHNHIIWNNVSFVDGKAYNSYKKTYYEIRKLSDKLCQEYGLSIIDNENPKQKKGKSYKEYMETKKGKSYKARLKYSIDFAIKKAKDWDDF